MNVQRHFSRKTALLAAAATLALLAFGQASASVVRINIQGPGGNGYANLTVGSADPSDIVDPTKVPMTITGASGMFGGAAITGVQALNHAIAPAGEVLPTSYSLFSIPGYGDHDGVSYDNLLYLNGSPLICYIDGTLVYPFSGGLLDLMGVMFTLDNGKFVDLWSMGNTAPGMFGPAWKGGLTYGVKIIEPTAAGGYEVSVARSFGTMATVPEPNSAWLLGAGVLGLVAWRRRARGLGNFA